MTVPLKTTDAEVAAEFVAQFTRVPLRECVSGYRVAEEFFTSAQTRMDRQIVVDLYLIPDKFRNMGLTTLNDVTVLRNAFARSLKKHIAAVFKSTGTKIAEVEAEQTTSGGQDQREEEMGADLTKRRSRRNEKNSYEPEEGETSRATAGLDNDMGDDDENVTSSFDSENSRITVNYVVGNVRVKILLESLVETVLSEVMVHEIPGVVRATVAEKPDPFGNLVVLTEGANFAAILNRNDVELDRFYSNDIYKIWETYGIEACRTAIIREVTAVFTAYGIDVDKRHLQLIADYLTNSGTYLGMSRHSMKNCSSPMQQMSFETTTQFLTHATLHGDSDQMGSPSACLAAGNVVHAGTGLCEIRIPFE
jgi:DNA-directed RNA polymerase I subunit RPA1